MEYEYWEDDYGQCPSSLEEEEELLSTQSLLRQMLPQPGRGPHPLRLGRSGR